MKTQLQTLKGFRDFLPAQKRKRDWVLKKVVETFEIFGFEPMETPTLEPLEIFEGQIGEDEKLFYKFIDNGGRKVALRYDQTVPICRAVAQYQNQLPRYFRRYQIQSVFRAENTQKGRYREFLQCDADVFGSLSPLADAEVITLSLAIYKNLGFKQPLLLLNDRSLMKDIPYDAIVAIDKLKKIGGDGVFAEMISKGISRDQANNYFEYVRKLQPNETVSTILRSLAEYGFDPSWYRFEPTLARSFSYSDGPIWEVMIPEAGSLSVLGGERYNNLVKEISGKDIPGTGFAVGFDRTVEAAEALGLIPGQVPTAQVLVTVFTNELKAHSLRTAAVLRKAGIPTELYPELDNLAKQFKLANQKQIPYVVTIGEQESQLGKVSLKDLRTGKQDVVSIEGAISTIKSTQG